MERIIKNKTFWLMLFVVSLGTILRVAFIDKPDGLWNDEYVSWYIASIPFGKTFWKEVFAQCHMPFYYFYLKFFIHFFGNSDLMLRLTSVPAGVLSIISMYFVGKEFKDEKLGFLCASITSISSFLIYFSQEVRFYGLLFLFSSLVLLFTFRLIKNQNLSNIIFFVISNLLVIFTHTIGFVFVVINLIFISLFLGKDGKYKKPIYAIWILIFLLSLIGLPLLLKILTTSSQSQFWGHFTLSRLGFLFTDYFSPVLTNIVSAPDNFFYDFNFKFIVFALLPTIIAIAGIIKALVKDVKKETLFSINYFLAIVCFAYIFVLVIAAITGKMVFVTKYSIEIYPILILLSCFGLLEFNKNWRYVLIFLFCFLNLFYIFISPVGAPKIRRNEGHKLVAVLLKNAKLQKDDFILLNYYPQKRFEKYFDFSGYRVLSINKGNYQKYLDEKFNTRFEEELLSKLKHNQKLVILTLTDVAMYSPMQIRFLKENKKEYNKVPYLFYVFSDLRNQEMKICLKTLQISRFEQKGSWSLATFIKK